MSDTISEAKLAANRANAQLSSGPQTPAGKAIASLNAVKTGLTGRTVLLSSDDASIYERHIARHFAELAPTTDREKTLVQFIADTEWRLLRIAPLEAGIFASGRLKLAEQFASHEDPNIREALLLNEIYTVYRKDVNNLVLQERRLRNQQKSDMADLKALQDERRAQAQEASLSRMRQVSAAMSAITSAKFEKRTANLTELGFDFSVSEVEAFWAVNMPRTRCCGASLDFDAWLQNHRAARKSEAQAA